MPGKYRTTWPLLLTSLLSTASLAGYFDRFHYTTSVVNKTPFFLTLTDSGLLFNRVESASRFTCRDDLVARNYRLPPGVSTLVGDGSSQDNSVDGYFLFAIGDTGKSFELYYHLVADCHLVADHHLAADRCHESWASLMDSDTGDTYFLMATDMSNACQRQARFPWFVPLEAWTCTNNASIHLMTDDEAVACIEDSDCTSDSHYRARREHTFQNAQKLMPKYARMLPPEPQAFQTLKQDLGLINSTPFTLKLSGYTTAHKSGQFYDFSGVRFNDGFQAGILLPNTRVRHAITLEGSGALYSSTLEGKLTFLVEETGESVELGYRLVGDRLCHPEFELIDSRAQPPGCRLTLRSANHPCILHKGSSGMFWTPGSQVVLQDSTLTFLVEESGGACTAKSQQAEVTGHPPDDRHTEL